MRRSGGRVVRRTGVTLVELLVVLATLGLMFGVSGLAFTSLRAPRESEWLREFRRARDQAIRSGRPVRAADPRPPATGFDRARPPLFLPDGRAIGPGADPLTGAPLDAPR